MVESFLQRTQQLMDNVGSGKLKGKVRFDQPYARYQHERMDLRHPRGGMAKYLQEPLMRSHPKYLQSMAQAAFQPNGLRHRMQRSMVGLNTQAKNRAPIEFGDLMRSGAITVIDAGKRVYYKPPVRKRLTKRELQLKYMIRNMAGDRRRTPRRRR